MNPVMVGRWMVEASVLEIINSNKAFNCGEKITQNVRRLARREQVWKRHKRWTKPLTKYRLQAQYYKEKNVLVEEFHAKQAR